MYKKFLWLSALTACFVAVFFAIFNFTKANKSIPTTFEVTENQNNDEEKPSISQMLDGNIDTNTIHGNAHMPRLHIKHHTMETNEKNINEQQKNSQFFYHKQKCYFNNNIKPNYKFPSYRTCKSEITEDTTEDNLLTTPYDIEQNKHLPFYQEEHAKIFNFFQEIFKNIPLLTQDGDDTFDIKHNNMFTIEIVQNCDENGWHLYINGQEMQLNNQINNSTNDTNSNNNLQNNTNNNNTNDINNNTNLQNNTNNNVNDINNNLQNNTNNNSTNDINNNSNIQNNTNNDKFLHDLENTPMPLPELGEQNPIVENKPQTDSNQSMQDETQPKPTPNTQLNLNTHTQESTILPEISPYLN